MKYFTKFLIISSLLFLPIFCHGFIEIPNPGDWVTLEDLVMSIIDIIFILAMAVTPIMIIIGGFYFVTAAGNPEQIKTGKSLIIWALVGLAIVFMAKGIVILLQDIITGGTTI